MKSYDYINIIYTTILYCLLIIETYYYINYGKGNGILPFLIHLIIYYLFNIFSHSMIMYTSIQMICDQSELHKCAIGLVVILFTQLFMMIHMKFLRYSLLNFFN